LEGPARPAGTASAVHVGANRRGYCSSSTTHYYQPTHSNRTTHPRTRQAAVCPAECIASYTRPDLAGLLFHTPALSTRDLFATPLSQQCTLPSCAWSPRHPPAERALSWIALLQPALDIPHTALRSDSVASHTCNRPRNTQPTSHGVSDTRAQSIASKTRQVDVSASAAAHTRRPSTDGLHQPDWRPTTVAAPNAG
jgi:hypothetical protein